MCVFCIYVVRLHNRVKQQRFRNQGYEFIYKKIRMTKLNNHMSK